MKTFLTVMIVFLIVTALLGPVLSSYNPHEIKLDSILQTPSSLHWLGTDENGRDILSRVLYGARVSLSLSILVTSISLAFGLAVGFFCAFSGKMVDKVFIVVSDIFQAFPGTLLAIAVAAFIPPGFLNLLWLLCFVGWVGYARVVRSQVLSLKQKEFVEASLSLGVKRPRLFFKHILPNIFGPVMVQASFGMAGVILTESGLSFLGLGLPPSIPSWGKMLDAGTSLLLVAPHVALFPGLAVMITILTFNLWGDYLRDRFS